jgi:hypothetical protein
MEELLYDKFQTVSSDYISDFKYRLMMLKDKSNPELKKRVLTKHISAKYVITCKVEDLASDKTKNELKILRMRSMESK